MKLVAFQLKGILAFMMINSSRQMDESVDPIKRENAFLLLEAEFVVRAGTFIEDPKILNSDQYKLASEIYGSKPLLSKENFQLASVVHGWLVERLPDPDGTTETQKDVMMDFLKHILHELKPSESLSRFVYSDETSTSASTGKKTQSQPKYIVDGAHLIRNYAKKRDAKLLRENETPIEQGQHTALEQPSGGKHTAARNGKASTSSTNKGKMLWEKPSTDQDKQQDELATPSKRSDGPSATRSKNTNSNRKNKGNKKKNWRH